MPGAVPDPAVALAAGLAVFPLPPGGRRPAPGWQQRCTRDPAALRRWWPPGANVGVGCRASGVVGLDLDRHGHDVDGVDQLAAVCAAHAQPWPDTLTVRTPSGGLHLYFRVPTGVTIGSTSGGRSALGSGIDTRGPGRHSGGYLVGPESIVDSRWYVIDDTNAGASTAIQPLPAWLTLLLAEHPAPTQPVPSARR
jgi:hypothetical protein